MTLTKDITNALNYFVKSDEKPQENNEWSVREQLALASAVIETGQEYWPSISRLIQSFGSNQRNEDKLWCSSKECAKQYSKLIDNIEKKKRSDNNNSTLPLKELIVKKLTVERIEELQADIRKEQEKQSALKELLNNLESGKLDESVQEMWNRLKENNDFIQFVSTKNETVPESINPEIEHESETTDAMTSSCVEDETNSDNDEKPRLLLHLKKTQKRLNENDSIGEESEAKSPKVDSDKESDNSCETEPAVYISSLSSNPSPVSIQEETLQCKVINIVDSVKMKKTDENINNLVNVPWVKKSKMIIGNVIDDPNCHLFDSQALIRKDSNYKNLIKQIINLIDIRNKLRDNIYLVPEEFEHDLLLVLCNAVMYYPFDSPESKIVRNIYDKISPLLECLHETDNDSLSSAEPISRRRTRKFVLNN